MSLEHIKNDNYLCRMAVSLFMKSLNPELKIYIVLPSSVPYNKMLQPPYSKNCKNPSFALYGRRDNMNNDIMAVAALIATCSAYSFTYRFMPYFNLILNRKNGFNNIYMQIRLIKRPNNTPFNPQKYPQVILTERRMIVSITGDQTSQNIP